MFIGAQAGIPIQDPKMFGTTGIPQTVPQQAGIALPSLLLDEMRQTNALLRGLLEAVVAANRLRSAPDEPDLDLSERVEWLERQVAELKGQQRR